MLVFYPVSVYTPSGRGFANGWRGWGKYFDLECSPADIIDDARFPGVQRAEKEGVHSKSGVRSSYPPGKNETLTTNK